MSEIAAVFMKSGDAQVQHKPSTTAQEAGIVVECAVLLQVIKKLRPSPKNDLPHTKMYQ